MMSCVDVFKVVEGFVNETNFTVWRDLTNNIAGVSLLFQYTDLEPNFDAFIRSLYSTVMNAVGWDSKPDEG